MSLVTCYEMYYTSYTDTTTPGTFLFGDKVKSVGVIHLNLAWSELFSMSYLDYVSKLNSELSRRKNPDKALKRDLKKASKRGDKSCVDLYMYDKNGKLVAVKRHSFRRSEIKTAIPYIDNTGYILVGQVDPRNIDSRIKTSTGVQNIMEFESVQYAVPIKILPLRS